MSGCLVVHFSWLRRAPGGRRRSPRASSRRAAALPGSARHRAQALPSTPAHRSSLALFAVLLWRCCGCGSSVAPALVCQNSKSNEKNKFLKSGMQNKFKQPDWNVECGKVRATPRQPNPSNQEQKERNSIREASTCTFSFCTHNLVVVHLVACA